MAVDLDRLQGWYRNAMLSRLDELRELRTRLDRSDTTVNGDARDIGRAIRGSGGTYGFPLLSEVAALLETSSDEEVARRVEGLIASLWTVVDGEDPGRPTRVEWLVRAGGLSADSWSGGDVRGLTDAWRLVSQRSGTAPIALARRVTEQLGLVPADLEDPHPAAVRLVPEALMRAQHLVPVRQDAETITLVAADPTCLPVELEVLKVTGRKPIFAVAPPELIDATLAGLITGRELPNAGLEETGNENEPEGTILVVDDDEDVRLFVRESLEGDGFAVIEAGDGVEALKALKASARSPALALVDLEMPRMNGRDLLRELRRDEADPKIPVIIVTSHEELLLELDLMEDGADDYIRKPFDPKLLIARVRATLQRTNG